MPHKWDTTVRAPQTYHPFNNRILPQLVNRLAIVSVAALIFLRIIATLNSTAD